MPSVTVWSRTEPVPPRGRTLCVSLDPAGRGPAGRHIRLPRLAAAGLAGVLAAGVALGVAELAAAAVGPRSSPVVAVGAAVIDLTPRPVKDLAIRTFAEDDKTALLVGTLLLLTVFAMAVGVAAARRLRVGLAGVAALGAVAAAAALTRPGATALLALPSLIGAAAGSLALQALVRPLRPVSAGPATPVPAGRAAPVATRGTVRDQPSAPAHDRSTDPAPRGSTKLMQDRKDAAFGRRGFLVTGATTLGVATVAGAAGRSLLQRRFDVGAARNGISLPAPASPAPPLPPGVDLKLDGLTPFTTRNADFYRVDTALVLPQVSPSQWRLRIHGQVRRELTLSYDDLLARDLIERDLTLTCVSNEVGGDLAGHARWLGVPLRELLDEVGPLDGADQVVSTSVDGWTSGTPTDLCRTTEGAMLAVGMNGEPLPVVHGFPVRMLVPGLYGYVSATKWLTDLRLASFAEFDPYWVQRGWKARAPVKVMSRIDTPRGLSERPRGTVRVAGVAWAQTRGIDRVECRVDGGSWQPATLAPQAGVSTWRQWVWDWPATEPGLHTVQVRATDAAGTTQPEQRATPFPDGATGWHSVVVTIA